MSTDTFRPEILALRDDLDANLIDRAEAVEAAIIALITREHLLLLGPPGTAKSLLVRAVCERIEGANYFERLLTKFSTPEELFGPLSLSGLESAAQAEVLAIPLTGAAIDAVIAIKHEQRQMGDVAPSVTHITLRGCLKS